MAYLAPVRRLIDEPGDSETWRTGHWLSDSLRSTSPGVIGALLAIRNTCVMTQRTVSKALPQAITTGLVIVVCLEVAAVGIRYALQVILARLTGPDDYGVFTVALTWAQMLAIPAGLGLSSVVIRYIPQYQAHDDPRRLRALISWSRTVSLWTGVLVASGGVLVVWVIDPAHAEALYIAMVAIPLFVISTLFTETLRGGGRLFASRVVPTILQPTLVLAAAVAVYLILGRLGSKEALGAIIGATLIGVAVQATAIRSSVGRGLRRGSRSVREWLGLGLQLLLIKCFQMILNLSDIILVGILVSPTAAGFYAAATKTVVLASLFTQAVNLALPAAVAKAHYQGDLYQVQQQLRWSARLVFLPSAALSAILIAAPEQLLSIFGEEFRTAGTALAILAIGRFASSFTGPVGSVLSVTGHQNVNIWVYGIAATMQVALDFVLIPHWGIEGAAVANSVAVVFWNFALYSLVMKRLPIRLWPLPALEGTK